MSQVCGKDTMRTSTSLVCPPNHHQHTSIQHYWNWWEIEYLKDFCEYHRYRNEIDAHINLGDFVLVKDFFLKRNYWKLRKMARPIKGLNERISAVTVKTYSNNSIHK